MENFFFLQCKYNKQSVYWALQKSSTGLYNIFENSYTRTYALIEEQKCP